MTDSIRPLKAEELYRETDPGRFDFESTSELLDGDEILGQSRAIRAIEFGIGMTHSGYNLYALGPDGTGKYTIVSRFLEEKAATEPTPDDWCYVHNFSVPHKPKAIRLPAGRGKIFRDKMKDLVSEMGTVLQAAFSAEEYKLQRQQIEEEARVGQIEAFEKLRKEAREKGIAFLQTPGGFAFAPLTEEGEVIAPEAYVKLEPERQKEVEAQVQELQEILQEILRKVPHWQSDLKEKVQELDETVARFAIDPLFESANEEFGDSPVIREYLSEVKADVISNFRTFLKDDEPDNPNLAAALGLSTIPEQSGPPRYAVNLIVDNSEVDGAPVIHIDQPRYGNLVGRIEHISKMGALVTDFTLIKPGALHTANGGYLVLDARRLLIEPFAWDAVKNALRREEIVIESLGQLYSVVSTVSLEPEPIPLDIKMVIVGERQLYYLLSAYDPEFTELFRVAADFADETPRDDRSEMAMARIIADVAREGSLRHFNPGATARVIEHSARLANDSQKLSTHMESIVDLIRQADYWAAKADHDTVTVEDVDKALAMQRERLSRVPERIREAMVNEQLLVATEGMAVGQINGLSVYQLGEEAFGRPSRITARVRMGDGEIIDIERKTELGGPIHSKGVMILTGFLGQRYATNRPLSFSATLVFEQSYSGVEGDSASCAELYALLSALSRAPINQGIAITGSMSQHGHMQVIGGVNEKIEGFFDLCQERGLTGNQGVIIPKGNTRHLMLRSDVVEAAAAGQFHIYPISHVDQGMALLTGVPMGEQDEDGNYPADSINGRIMARLKEFAEKRKEFSAMMSKDEVGEA